jgi:arylsulfatase A-like enzyme
MKGVESRDARENIILLTIDSLRADHCGFMGCKHDTTPTLDRLARNGVVFENAIAPGPRTPSSMPVAFTGRFGRQEEVPWSDWRERWNRIADLLRRHRTLAERLQSDGYTTIGVTANPWTQKTGFDLGFDRFLELQGADAIKNGSVNGQAFRVLDWLFDRTRLGREYQWDQARDWFVQWTHYYDRILKAVRKVEQPYFLWAFALDPHQPYLAPRRHRRETSTASMYYANVRERVTGSIDELSSRTRTWLKRSYRDSIRSADRLVAALEDDLAADDPTFVVHADHGEAFGEHGTFGHEEQVYEENLHVPLVVSGVGSQTVRDPVSLRSLPALLERLASGEAFHPEEFTREYVTAATEGVHTRARTVRGRRWKYITNGVGSELYDLNADPGETENLIEGRPELVEQFQCLLEARHAHDTETGAIVRAVDTVNGAGKRRTRRVDDRAGR